MLVFLNISVASAVASTANYYSKNFSDVNVGTKYGEAIDFLFEEEIISGYEDGTYKPDKILNRAELSKIITEAFVNVIGGIDDYSDNECFTDISSNKWYADYICVLGEYSLIDGYPDGTFRPEEPINLAETLKIILGIFKIDYDAETTPWYKGIIDTASTGNFIPLDFTSFNQNVTRGQMTDITTRVKKHVKDWTSEDSNSKNDYLGFLTDYRVTYEDLENNKSIDEEARDIEQTYGTGMLQFENLGSGLDYQAALYSSNAVENTETSCLKDYVSGDFTLAILNLENGGRDKVLSKVDIGYKTVFPMGAIHYINMDYGPTPMKSLILVEEYGDCNGNLFSFFRPSNYYSNFTEVNFSDLEDNKIYASSIEDIHFDDIETFNHEFYDNSKGEYIKKYYSWDEDSYSFILQ